MIPKNIEREHVIMAIESVDISGIRKGRKSKIYFLEYNGKHYPPKYIISLANKYVNGSELLPSVFNGGKETNDFLSHLYFQIVR